MAGLEVVSGAISTAKEHPVIRWIFTAVLCLGVEAVAAQKDAGVPAAPPAAAVPARGSQAPATVNWEGQVVRATGSGAPNLTAATPAQARLGAEKAAQMDAFRNLLSQVKGIQVSAGKTVGDEMERDEVRGKVEGLIRGYKIVAKRYYSDNGVEMDVEVPLAALTEALLPAPAGAAAVKAEGEKKNTGLVIDARKVSVTPALAPKVLDDAGKVLYSVDFLSADARKSSVGAAYTRSLEEAKKSDRVGDKPLVVTATKAQGADLVLGAADAKRLSEGNNSFLSDGRVIIVTGQ